MHPKDLTGQKFGKWTVLRQERDRGKIIWLCECACGKLQKITSSNLTSGHTLQCRACLSESLRTPEARARIREKFKEFYSQHPEIRRQSKPRPEPEAEPTYMEVWNPWESV